MKKVLSLALILSLGIAGFAQTRHMALSEKAQMRPKVAIGNEKATETSPLQNVENTAKAIPSKAYHDELVDEYEVMINSYDLQSNCVIANRLASWQDGSLATVATFMPGDKNPYNQASGYRGTGYNFFDGSDFGEQPEARIESSMTGWPSIAPFGPNGEIIVCHNGSGLLYMTRETKGEGDWNGPFEIPNPEGHASVTTDNYSLSWPRVATCGANHDIIIIVSSDQSSSGSGDDAVYEYTAFLTRSTDGGETWTTIPMPGLANDGVNQCTADDYSIAAHGNNVAVLFSSPYNAGGGEYHTTDVVLVKSTDAGENWTPTVVWDDPIEGNWFDPFVFDTMNHDALYLPVMGTVAMDNYGKAHVALTAERVKAAEASGSYSYYYGIIVDGVFYWKEGDEPFTTGPTFENGYSDPYKALCPYDTYDLGVDEDGDGEEDFLTAYNDRWIAGTVIAQYGENQEDPDEYWDYVTLQKFIKDKTDEELEEEPIYFVEYFDGYSNYTNHLYRGTGTYETVNGNYARCMGAGTMCGWPSITVDDNGIVAIAYSTPDFRRNYDGNNFSYRAVYVTYIDHGVIYPNASYLAEDFSHMVDEMVNVHALPTSYGDRQFVFSYACDATIGWAGTSASSESDPPAHNPAENTHFVAVVVPDPVIDEVKESINPMNSVSVRPNPANETLYIDINASQRSEMTATVYNITGQKVMEQNMSALTTGANTRSINVSNLTSGIYFVTVKANGFEETKKFVVK